MSERIKYAVSITGAVVLAGSVLTNAFASRPVVQVSHLRNAAKTTTFNGPIKANSTLRTNKNFSAYGKAYLHGSLQVWKGARIHDGGLTVDSGGVKADALTVSGPIQGSSATFTSNVQAASVAATGQLSGGTLSVSGAGTVGGALTASGDITGDNIKANGNLTATGSFTALAGNLTNLTVSGSVNFANAAVTGLNVSNLTNLSLGTPSSTTAPLALSENGSTTTLGVDASGSLLIRDVSGRIGSFQSLALGTNTATTPPLSLTENGKTASLGVDTNGNLTLASVAASGNVSAGGTLDVTGATTLSGGLTVSGGNGVVSSNVQAPPTSSTNTNPGALSLTGSSITLNGATTTNGALTLGGDLGMSFNAAASTPIASHVLSNGDTDVAGVTAFTIPVGASPATPKDQTITFTRAYASAPIVNVTPAANDPSDGTGQQPAYWVTATTTDFTIHVAPPTVIATAYPVVFNYVVVGR